MKNIILSLSIIGTSLFLFIRSNFFVSYIFENYRGFFLTNNLELIHNSIILFPIVLFFSIVTYKASERIFTMWWEFARVALPIILLLTIVINLKLHHNPGGWINMDADIDRVVLVLIYAIFVIGSLIQIIRGYRQK